MCTKLCTSQPIYTEPKRICSTVPLDTRRLLLVGNGGIATEIAHEVLGCQVVWAIKDASISTPFLDPSAARFLLDARDRSLRDTRGQTAAAAASGPDQTGDQPSSSTRIRRMRYVVATDEQPVASNDPPAPSGTPSQLVLVPDNRAVESSTKSVGAALGPDWAFGMDLQGAIPAAMDNRLLKKLAASPSLFVFSNASRTNAAFFGTSFDLAPASAGGGLLVDDQMQTSVPDVYAAGDCAFANWTWAPHWIQMRLWSQARQMGFQAAKAMFGHARGEQSVPLDFTFELFTHVTYFFGFKVVLLGLFNGQGLDLTSPDCYLLMRVTPGEEYVKCVMQSGRMQGALLIGETDLEETLENLIVNQLDLINLEDSLLDPNIDLSDYFD
ncbi:unnamed protein product [Echinostoma caproni]|uniref:Pyr_redox_2 domain-containing protein n=1 Tax=Echinostoma caproni TaxID=27848 RepID=A0A183ANW0_9TREM|nr:unnamed protein product [Echinostoma caproni]